MELNDVGYSEDTGTAQCDFYRAPGRRTGKQRPIRREKNPLYLIDEGKKWKKIK